MKTIKLTNGEVTLVSDKDYPYLSKFEWHKGSKKKNYVYRKSKGVTILLHREVRKSSKDLEVDHKDMNTLNNQRSNLRACTHTQNLANRGMNCNNTSGYKGVFFKKFSGRWQAQIAVNGKDTYLGTFDDPRDAAKAYDDAAKKYYGKYARTNEDI